MTKQEFDDYVDAIWVYKTEGRKDVSNSEIDAHSCSSVSRVFCLQALWINSHFLRISLCREETTC